MQNQFNQDKQKESLLADLVGLRFVNDRSKHSALLLFTIFMITSMGCGPPPSTQKTAAPRSAKEAYQEAIGIQEGKIEPEYDYYYGDYDRYDEYGNWLGDEQYKEVHVEKRLTEAIQLDSKFHQAYAARYNLRKKNAKKIQGALDDLSNYIELRPGNARAHVERAQIYRRLNQPHKMIDDLLTAAQLDPYYSYAVNDASWELGTNRNAEIRDGKLAVELGLFLNQQTKFQQEMYVDTLAAAYAEYGDFTKAVKYQKDAITLAIKNDSRLLREYESRLDDYRQSRKYRQ